MGFRNPDLQAWVRKVGDSTQSMKQVKSLFVCTDGEYPAMVFEPNDEPLKPRVVGGVHLLRNNKQSLFPSPGTYQITFQIGWVVKHQQYYAEANGVVNILPSFNLKEAQISSRLLNNSNLLRLMVFRQPDQESTQLLQQASSLENIRPWIGKLTSRLTRK